jgi:hypothetical protein
MTGRLRRLGSRLVPAALAAGLSLAGCGGSRPPSSGGTGGATVPSAGAHTLSVRPSHPTTRSEVAFGYTVPVASGVHGSQEIGYSLSLTGPAGAGCAGVHEQNGPTARRGQAVSITVGPRELGRRWCAGEYTARVIELQRAHCTGSAACPQYIRVVGIIARASFTVTGH